MYSITLSLFSIVNGDGWLNHASPALLFGNKPVPVVSLAG